MTESNDSTEVFDFDPEQLTELGDLAEAFIHEELDAELFKDLDREYLEQLVDSGESQHPTDVNEEEYKAALEVAELILDRMDTAEQ